MFESGSEPNWRSAARPGWVAVLAFTMAGSCFTPAACGWADPGNGDAAGAAATAGLASRPKAAGAQAASGAPAQLETRLRDTRLQMFFTALTFGFALLHLILFLFLPRQISNLYYALFLLFYALSIYCDFQALLHDQPSGIVWWLRWHRAFMGLSLIFGLRFFYALFVHPRPRRFVWIASAVALAGVLAVIEPDTLFGFLQIASALVLIESIRIMIQAARRGQPNAWIIAVGFGFFALFSLYDLFLDLDLLEPIAGLLNGYQFGTVGLFVATSIYLARDIARTQGQLLEQRERARKEELERRLLELEFENKRKELEEARELQVAMLPASLPELPHLEIAVQMQTATEVGGDYYDLDLDGDGTLTAVVGDATGHGMRAGIMVAIAKSLFRSAARQRSIPDFFQHSSTILKQLQLGQLMMAMAMVRIQGRRLSASAAGMPPILIYRRATREIEELLFESVPLGAFPGFDYPELETDLRPGDTVLMMSDGFYELLNPAGEAFDLPRVERLFREGACQPPEILMKQLTDAAQRWRAGRPQSDDITFVILRAKDPAAG